MIFCALSNRTTKVRQAQAAIIRFSTIPYDFTCYLATGGFLAVHPGNPRWALPRVKWAAWRAYSTHRTCGRPTPPRAYWGIGCVRPSSWAPPRRAVGSRGRGLPPVLTVVPFLRRLSAVQIAHHAAHFLQILVGTRTFCATYVRFQEREKYWNDGLMYVFCRFREKKRQIFRASAQVLHARRGDFADDLSRFCILSYSMVCCKLLVISLLKGREDRKAFQFQLFQLNFKGWRFYLLLYISI